MPTTQLAGPIGPFFDNVQQRGVPVSVQGSCDFTVGTPIVDAARLDNDVRNHMLNAIRTVIGQKMATGQLQFRNLGEGTIGSTADEIVAASGLAQLGITVGNLAMSFAIDNGPPQREVRAHINVGGFHVNASSTGGINAGSLANQAINKAKSAVIWYVMTAVIVAAVGGIAWWYIKHTVKKALTEPTAATAAAAKWDGTTPLACVGSQELTITGVKANLPAATAVTAAGGCKLTLVNCDLTGTTGIEAGGSAIVTVTGGSITGSTFAVHAMGAAEVHVTGTKVTGKTTAMGAAKITGI